MNRICKFSLTGYTINYISPTEDDNDNTGICACEYYSRAPVDVSKFVLYLGIPGPKTIRDRKHDITAQDFML